jgi:membrane-associated protease RseP (regulator of RpoE activity)
MRQAPTLMVVCLLCATLTTCGATRGSSLPDSDQTAAYPLAEPISSPGVTVIIEVPAPVLGVVISATGEVIHIEPDSAAAQSQLHVGDTILAIDDLSLADRQRRSEIKERIRRAGASNPVTLRITRQGVPGELLVLPMSPANRRRSTTVQVISTVTPVVTPVDYL